MRGNDHGRRVIAGRAAALAAGLLLLASSAVASTGSADLEAAQAAARQALRAIFGSDADVQLDEPVLTLVPEAGLVVAAVPEPSSRTGGPVRFVLYGDLEQTRRVGRLTARVDVRATHVRVRAKVAARAVPTADVLETVVDDIGRQPLTPLPRLEAVAAATTRKALLPGEVVTQAALVMQPLVASGQDVMTFARAGALEVRGRAVAAQSGQLGDTVIVVNPETRRRLRGRVVGDALVEVQLGS